jgi:hypothetical protein
MRESPWPADEPQLAPRTSHRPCVGRRARRALSAPAPANPYLGRDQRRGLLASAGDELLEDADGVSTRAITIDAPAASVWPWLAQMGPSPRGGAYTYDWIENLLGLDMHSVDRVLPEPRQRSTMPLRPMWQGPTWPTLGQ